jgi:hypothetical protein
MKVTWRRGLKGADYGERQSLLEAEALAERIRAEEIVGYLCLLSDTGLSDCAALAVSCRTRRWCRSGPFLYSSIECISAHPGTECEYSWRLRRVPGTRPIVRSCANKQVEGVDSGARLRRWREGR